MARLTGAEVGASAHPLLIPLVYLRLHGSAHRHPYAGSSSDADLAWWADRIVEWRDRGHAVFAYCNNDGDGNAVSNAARLRAMVEGEA